MRVRDARPEDSPALAPLLAELGYPDDAEAVRERVEAIGLDASSFVLVAEASAQVVGLASASMVPLLHEAGSWCRLSALVVAEDGRRAGVGRRLVAEVERRARANGCRYLEVTSGERARREGAHRFFAALELEQVSRRYLKEL